MCSRAMRRCRRKVNRGALVGDGETSKGNGKALKAKKNC